MNLTPSPANGRGSILVVVLVVLAVLSLGAYTFSEFMRLETKRAMLFSRDAQARAAADSGIELVSSLLTQRYQQAAQSYYSNPEWFQGIVVQNSELPGLRSRFSVVSPVESDPSGRVIRFGLTDESAKINVNTLPTLFPDNAQARTVLQYIPNMTPEITDAILDWVDTNTTARPMGAEDETYAPLGYKTRNAPLHSLDELLLVQGVTPWLLFGEDANRNGLLDPNENDGEATPPFDNADGLLERGWSAFLTVHGREGNLKADGTPKINVNMNALGDLFDQVSPILGEDEAKFIVAFRMAGPKGQQQQGSGGSAQPQGGSGGGSQGGGSAAGNAGGEKPVQQVQEVQERKAGTSQVQAVQAQEGRGATSPQQSGGGSGGTGQTVNQTAGAVSSAASMAGGQQVTRAGINVTSGGQVQLKSLYELVGVQVQININGTDTTLDSPWTNDAGLRQSLPLVFENLTVKTGQFIDGRINVNQARPEVLLGLPNITQSIVDQIVNAQASAAMSPTTDRNTTAWLLTDGIIDLPTMRLLDPYLTARGEVFRLQSVGYYDKGGPSVRIEAVIDATQDPPTVVFMRDLTDLGRGFSAQLLTTGLGGTQ